MNAVLPFARSNAPHDPFGDPRSARASGADERPVVVFDLDGTLVDTAPDLAASLNHCLSLAGIAPVTVNEIRPHAGHGARAMLVEAYRSAGRPVTSAELDRQISCFLEFYEGHIAVASELFPGALDAIARLDTAGAILAVCTNKTEHLARLLLRELGLHDRFAAICGADSFPARKPDPVHLLGTIALAGAEVKNAIMVGDTQTDVDAALRIGIPSVLVDFGYDPTNSARRDATVTVSRFEEVDATLVTSLLKAQRTSGRSAPPAQPFPVGEHRAR